MSRKQRTEIQLSDHFTPGRLLRFAFPSVIMMVFTSIYGVVDGYFISNFAGKIPFAAINLIMPFPMILGSFGFLVGTGGSALVGKTLGEQKPELANRYFTMLVRLAIYIGLGLSVLGIVLMRPVALWLGATEDMVDDCVRYGCILALFNVTFVLQAMFQTFLVTAEKPKLGLAVTVSSGVVNMVLDAVFVGWLGWGVVGAALATGVSQATGGLFPLLYFARPNTSLLRMVKTKIELRPMLRAFTNGISELMSNLSASIVAVFFNIQLLAYAGADGVATYGVLMYVSFLFVAVFFGYAMSAAPIVSYNYGAENHRELKNILKISTAVTLSAGFLMAVLGIILAVPISQLYVGYDRELFRMTVRAFRIYSFSFLLAGINIYASSFFTALNNGPVSAVISFLRSLVFQLISVLVLPILFGVDGIWWAVAVSDLAAFLISLAFLVGLRKKYHYLERD